MRAEVGSEVYGIMSNPYLATQARAITYEVTITVGDGTWTYASNLAIEHTRWHEVVAHTDRNTLHRVS